MVASSFAFLAYGGLAMDQAGLAAQVQLAHKSDLCGLNTSWDSRACADAVLEQLAQLIYVKVVYESLAFLARRLIGKLRCGRGVPAQQLLV
eukprot:587470-Amphidinium_carterae.1